MDPSRPDSLSTDTANVSDDSLDSHDFEKVDLDVGTTAPGILVPRERFSFWCFDLSESPSKFSDSQPTVDASLSPSALIADVVKRSPVAHILYFYSVLCKITSIPRKMPLAWVITNSSPPETNQERRGNVLRRHIGALEEGGDAMEVDARTLARKALQILGKEMGTI